MTVAATLIAAALAGFVAWVVALRQGKIARENWVRDKRYGLYESVLKAGIALGAVTWEETRANARDHEKVHPLRDHLVTVSLLAPERVRDQGEVVAQLTDRTLAGDETAVPELGRAIGILLVQLREDLVPKHMR